jgi:hypothetical protein
MFVLATLLVLDPFSRALRLAALLYGVIDICFSSYFRYLQVTFIHAFASIVSSLQSQRLFCLSQRFRILGSLETLKQLTLEGLPI